MCSVYHVVDGGMATWMSSPCMLAGRSCIHNQSQIGTQALDIWNFLDRTRRISNAMCGEIDAARWSNRRQQNMNMVGAAFMRSVAAEELRGTHRAPVSTYRIARSTVMILFGSLF